jgi:hypothetical protein
VGHQDRISALLSEVVVADEEPQQQAFRLCQVELPVRHRQPAPAQAVEAAADAAERLLLLEPQAPRVEDKPVHPVAVVLLRLEDLPLQPGVAAEADAALLTRSNSSARSWIPTRR